MATLPTVTRSIAATAALALGTIAFAAAPPASAGVVCTTTAPDVPVHSAPDPNAPVVTKVPYIGTPLGCTGDSTTGWLRVSNVDTGASLGYVGTIFLDTDAG